MTKVIIMKEALSIILAILFVLSIGAVGVFAATRRSSGKFVDVDKNGICDNRGTSSAPAACPNNGERRGN